MKKMIFVLAVAAALASCKKDKDAPATAKTIFMSKLTWVYGPGGTYNNSDSYTLDANNKLSSNGHTINEKTTTQTNNVYKRNTAGQVIKRQSETSYSIYEYNSAGQLSKSSVYRTSDGTLVSYYVFNYSADGYERVSYSAAGVAGSKLVCTYTADKKNIAKEAWYQSNGTLNLQREYSYYTTKNPESIYPYSEVVMLDRGFVSQNAVSITSSSVLGTASGSTTSSYTYNDEGYPLTQKDTYSDGSEPDNCTYEYIKK